MTTPPESLLTFPCDFPIKVFGLASDRLQNDIVRLVRETLPDFSETNITTRPSGEGKYQALTLNVHVESREQLDHLYRQLTASPLVLMAL